MPHIFNKKTSLKTPYSEMPTSRKMNEMSSLLKKAERVSKSCTSPEHRIHAFQYLELVRGRLKEYFPVDIDHTAAFASLDRVDKNLPYFKEFNTLINDQISTLINDQIYLLECREV